MLHLLRPPLQFRPDELFRVPTDDGNAIALGRYHPRGPRRFQEPVLLGHSLATNRFNLDFDERYSVARHLAAKGFEVYVLELRGHGLAGSATGSHFDVEVKYDVTAALRAVKSTGAREVLWAGHSRGGLLAYAHLARFPDAPIKAVATLGSPVEYGAGRGLLGFVKLVGPALALDVLPLRLATRVSVLTGLPPEPVGQYLVRKENMDAHVIHHAIRDVAADVPGGLARDFARWIRTGAFDAKDGFDYREAMRGIRAPVLAVAGTKDLLSPLEASHAVARHVGGPVELVTAGRAFGFKADYGHGDLVLGRHAPDEVLPRVAHFLERHATSVSA